MHLLDLLAVSRQRAPDRPALVFHADPASSSQGGGETPGGQRWTYGELAALADGVAGELAERGVGRGDRVALYVGNRPELAVAFLAILRLGAVALPINTAYRHREIGHILADAEPALLLTEASRRPELAGLADLPGPERAASRVPVADVEALGAFGEDHPADATPATPPPAPRTGPPGGAGDLAMLLYTSGTTGRSKGAMITHANLTAWTTSLHAAWGWRPEDRLLLTLPLFHVHGLVVGLLTALLAGATVELHARFDAARVVDRFVGGGGSPGVTEDPPPSLFFGVPTMYVRLVDELRGRAEAAPSPLAAARLFASGSAPLAVETFTAFRRLTGHTILERYGMTETGITLSNLYAGERRPGSVGVPLPGVTARVVGDAGEPLADGEEGELQVAGSGLCAGYWRAPEKTAASFADDPEDPARRWFRTGDLARRDPETGAYTLLGRRGDLILTGGYNVYPREVEEALLEMPGVAEVAVAGVPDRDRGELVAAWVVPRSGAEPPSREEVRAHLDGRLASFKVPRRVFAAAELPRNALGKVQRHRLRVPPGT